MAGVRRAVAVVVLGASLAMVVAEAPARATQRGLPCRDSGNVPVTDLREPYRGLPPGRFPGGATSLPDTHLAAGRQRARLVVPRDVKGAPSPDGRIGLLAVGMSNTASEFEQFMYMARETGATQRRLVLVNGALGGADASAWVEPSSRAWQFLLSTLGRGGGLSAEQVQVIWLKQGHLKTADFPGEIERLADNLGMSIAIARKTFPNLQLVYVSSRTRSGADTRRGPGEPQAYETAWAVRRLLERQPSGQGAAPWISWGPYLWAAATPRSDGLSWDCEDLEPDRLHPSAAGSIKVAAQLLTFFATEPTAKAWFLDPSDEDSDGLSEISASVMEGPAPLDVDLMVRAPWASAYHWSFADGTSARTAAARKTFHVPGVYQVGVTVFGSRGRWAHRAIAIRVGTR